MDSISHALALAIGFAAGWAGFLRLSSFFDRRNARDGN